MKKKVTNIARLEKGGIVPKENRLTDEEQGLLEKLTPAEVNALISAKKKLGESFLKRHAKPSKSYGF